MEWYNLPEEMRARPQWICANEDKEPMSVHGGPAMVDNPSTWGTFEEATRAAIWNGYDVAYVLAADDPFTIIDLDNKESNPATDDMTMVHRDIIRRANGYIERSVSGTGFHVIVKGKPPKPVKTPHVEQYGDKRYMICTGDVVRADEPGDGQELLELIDHYFGSLSTALALEELPDWIDGEEVEDDSVIYERAANAENGDKFLDLWGGDITKYGNDHSAADSALLNLLCFYTPHNAQVRRMFKASMLYREGQRNKQDAYMNYSIGKWRGENMPIDLSTLRFPTPAELKAQEIASVQEQYEPTAEAAAEYRPEAKEIEIPPGLVGDLAKWLYKHSYRPVAEGAVAAAIGYVAGLIARSYHVNGRGLNQYCIFLAGSGVGKEGAKEGLRKVHEALSAKVPPAHPHLGSGDFSAGVSLIKDLAASPCCVSMIGEVGQTFQIMLDPRAPAHLKELKKAMLEAWSASGPNGHLSGRRYSDKSKNAGDVRMPAWSCIGESVPEEFYKALTVASASEGFVPRFFVFEYPGDRVSPNRKRAMELPPGLIDRLGELYVAAKSIIDHGIPVSIPADEAAGLILTSYEDHIDEEIRSLDKQSPLRAILNRCYEKALRLAGLFAAAENPYQPVITAAIASAAIRMVERCDKRMLEKFKNGDVVSSGMQSEDQYTEIVKNIISKYIIMKPHQRQQYKCPKNISAIDVIPLSFLKDQLKRRQAIKEHPRGPIQATNMALKESIEIGMIVPVGALDRKAWGINQPLYRLGDGFNL